MENQNTALVPSGGLELPGFGSTSGFDLLQRQAVALSKSSLVPEQFRANVPNCIAALEMSCRMKASPLMVMQNLYMVHGKPGWSSTFIIASVNAGGRFTPLRFVFEGERGKDTWGCKAVAKDKESGEVCEGEPVTMAMAKAEGWVSKSGSKWQTMPGLMMRYRAATFWARLYCPESLMGMRPEDEIIDIGATAFERAKPVTAAPIFGGAPAITEQPADAEPVPVEEPEAMTNRDKLGVTIGEASLTVVEFENSARRAGYLEPAETIAALTDEQCGELLKDFNVILNNAARKGGGK